VAAIATTVFSKEAKNSANILRMPDFVTVEITHPLSTLTQVQIRERAYEAVRSIVPIITGQEVELREETREKAGNLMNVQYSNNIKEVESCADE